MVVIILRKNDRNQTRKLKINYKLINEDKQSEKKLIIRN